MRCTFVVVGSQSLAKAPNSTWGISLAIPAQALAQPLLPSPDSYMDNYRLFMLLLRRGGPDQVAALPRDRSTSHNRLSGVHGGGRTRELGEHGQRGTTDGCRLGCSAAANIRHKRPS